MTRTHGRCARGQRLVGKVPHGDRKPLTFVAGLRCDGITAPCLLDGPINAETFLAWIVQFLLPTLRRGDIVVMDNLSSHKDPAVRAAIRSIGAVLSAAVQSGPEPDRAGVLQAENAATQGNARSFDRVSDCIAKLIQRLTPEESRNYFSRAGYAST